MYSSIIHLLHFAVPVFFMISGALLLNPRKELPINKLLKNYIWKYVLVLLFFAWGYAFIEEVFVNKSIKFNYLITSFADMLQGKTWAHMWYMYSLLGVMLCVPILRAVTKNLKKEEIKYLCIVSFALLGIVPLFSYITGYKFGVNLAMGNIYCFYMLLGYWIDTEEIKIPRMVAYIFLVVMSLILVVSAYIRGMGEKDLGIQGYWSPVIIIYSVSVYSLVHHKYMDYEYGNTGIDKIVAFLSNMSFVVYLIHMFWINLRFKFLGINPFYPNAIIGFVITGMLVLILSVVTVWLLKKIPFLKKMV